MDRLTKSSAVDMDHTTPRASDVTVVICAYTVERWSMLCSAVESALNQTHPAYEIMVSVDHNRELFERCRGRWGEAAGAVERPKVTVMENRYAGRLGSARTTAAELATTEYIAFLDDDAAAEPTWLERLLKPYQDPSVIAVGGSPLPNFTAPRPRWFPLEFDWVFGCSYVGLPTEAAPVRHVIGANMSVRRRELIQIGGFHSDNHDDMDMCHRLLGRWPEARIIFEPTAIVWHCVHKERLTWRYFWRRCYFVNLGKVGAFRHMGEARNLKAEGEFAKQALLHGIARELGQLLRGDVGGLLRACSLCAGLALGGAGYATGSIKVRRSGGRRIRQPGGADGGDTAESSSRGEVAPK